jgi:HK97 gp10 family phage protein
MAGRFKPRPGRSEPLRQLQIRRMEPKANRVLWTAVVTAPVDTGAYRRSLKKERTANGWRISANTHYARYLEFGTRKMRAYRTLGRALDAAKER